MLLLTSEPVPDSTPPSVRSSLPAIARPPAPRATGFGIVRVPPFGWIVPAVELNEPDPAIVPESWMTAPLSIATTAPEATVIVPTASTMPDTSASVPAPLATVSVAPLPTVSWPAAETTTWSTATSAFTVTTVPSLTVMMPSIAAGGRVAATQDVPLNRCHVPALAQAPVATLR